MSYADTLLADREQIMLRTRQHPISLLRDAARGLLVWLLAIVLVGSVVWFNLSGGVAQVIGLIALFLFVVGLVMTVWQWLLWWTEEYIVTNRRLLKVSGLLNKNSADSSLEKINDAILSVSMWGRILNYGDLDILTAAEQTVDKYRMLNGARKFKIVMLNEKHNLEVELASGGMPSAPLRADLPPAPQQQAAPPPMAPSTAEPPPAAPPPPPAPAVDPTLEVTQTLARLADLRDRGAITPQEYEAKKQELLGRL